jgi:hypothetical protein
MGPRQDCAEEMPEVLGEVMGSGIFSSLWRLPFSVAGFGWLSTRHFPEPETRQKDRSFCSLYSWRFSL